jgi:hypothetical protein
MDKIDYERRRAEAAANAERAKEEKRNRERERKEERRRQEQRMLAVAEGHQLFVGGLSTRCDDTHLSAYFSRFGPITDHVVVRDLETRLPRGFGFVTFPSQAHAAAAVAAANGAEARELCVPHGRLAVKFAEKSKAQLDFEARRAATLAAGGQDRPEEGAAVDGIEADSPSAEPAISVPAAQPAQATPAAHAPPAALQPPPPPPTPASNGVKQWPAPPETLVAPPPPPPAKAAPPPARAGGAPAPARGRTGGAGRRVDGPAGKGACGRSEEGKVRLGGPILPAGAEAA